MNVKFDAYIRGLPEDEQDAIKARAAELISEERTLLDLHKARAVDQAKPIGKPRSRKPPAQIDGKATTK